MALDGHISELQQLLANHALESQIVEKLEAIPTAIRYLRL